MNFLFLVPQDFYQIVVGSPSKLLAANMSKKIKNKNPILSPYIALYEGLVSSLFTLQFYHLNELKHMNQKYCPG